MQAVAKGCVTAGVYCGVGLTVPIAPTAVAVMAVIMVRILVWTKNRSLGWNFTVCGLAMLAAAVTIEGSEMNVFRAFWLGAGYGAMGVSIIEIAKGAVGKALAERFTNATQVLFGIKPKGD